MKANTVEQFKILEYIKDNFIVDNLDVKLLDKNSVKITDKNNESMIFSYVDGKIVGHEI